MPRVVYPVAILIPVERGVNMSHVSRLVNKLLEDSEGYVIVIREYNPPKIGALSKMKVPGLTWIYVGRTKGTKHPEIVKKLMELVKEIEREGYEHKHGS